MRNENIMCRIFCGVTTRTEKKKAVASKKKLNQKDGHIHHLIWHLVYQTVRGNEL